MHDTTTDALLGGRLQLTQPLKGYRAGNDPVFLAASIPIKQGEHVLDVGTGAGTALLCLAARDNSIKGVGVEVQENLATLALQNTEQNNLDQTFTIIKADIFEKIDQIKGLQFNHVLSNPPFFESEKTTVSSLSSKKLGRMIEKGDLQRWVSFCIKHVRPKGTITLIYRTEGLVNILKTLDGKVGDIKIFPLWSKRGEPAKRFIIQGRNGAKGPPQLLAGLVLHDRDGTYYPEVDKILRHGAALKL